MKSRTTYYHNVGEHELELPIKPSDSLHDSDVLVYEKNGKIMLGYLFDDPDVDNPTDSDSSFGHIYSAHRHSPSHEEMQKALGLNSDWQPDLEAIDEEAVIARAFEVLKDSRDLVGNTMATLWISAVDYFNDYWTKDEDEDLLTAMESTWECESELQDAGVDTDAVRKFLWDQGRLDGSIGDKHAVSLDVYEHGLTSYSVSGGGTQCQWDTAKGGAVWVPSDCAREEIVRRGEVYHKGGIKKRTVAGKVTYDVRTWQAFGIFNGSVAEFNEWHEAFEFLKSLPEPVFMQPLLDAEDDAAKEMAASAAEVYTDWCNGNCYGYCIVVYNEDGDQTQDSTCGGFIGIDYAKSSLKEEFDSWKQNL